MHRSSSAIRFDAVRFAAVRFSAFRFAAVLGLALGLALGPTDPAVAASDRPLTFEEALDWMKPYDGLHSPGVDTSTLVGKVLCGYQGWYSAVGDGMHMGWNHYAGSTEAFENGYHILDHWPDMSEMDDDEKYPTPFRHADGTTATLFSSAHPKTVMRHFRWMRDHGIDGVFLQRFGVSVWGQPEFHVRNVVTRNVQAGANRYGRSWAMMYDLTSLQPGQIESIVMEDWKRLVDRMEIRKDRAYQRHDGKPVVAVWGIGFDDGRAYTLDECMKLVRFLQDDPVYGGNTVKIGIPAWWRTLERDAVADPFLHEIVKTADIVSPWNVGRYRFPDEATTHALTVTAGDLAWCREHGKDYMPVLFPGFSWQNLMRIYGQEAELDAIPRLGGEFYWRQARDFTRLGATMLYAAMFDEINEGTGLLKSTDDPPVGKLNLLTYEGLPTDHYLWLTGRVGRLLRGEIPPSDTAPTRE